MEGKIEEKKKRKRTKRKFSLPEANLKFEKEIEILKALVESSRKGEHPVSYKEIHEEIHKVVRSKTYISSELAFFAYAGMAKKEKGSEYLPTKEVIEFVNSLNWDEDDAKIKLREILSKSWFGDITIKILKDNGGKIRLDDLVKKIGKKAEADPNKDVKAIKRLVKWLEYAGIVEIDENKIVRLKKIPVLNNNEDESKDEAPPTSKIEEVTSETIVEEKTMQSGENKKVRKEILLNLTINIQIDSNTDVEKVREIMKVIQQYLVGDDDE